MNRCFLSALQVILLPASLIPLEAQADSLREVKNQIHLVDPSIQIDINGIRAEGEAVGLFDGKISLEPADQAVLSLPGGSENEKRVMEETRVAPGQDRLPVELRTKWRAFFAESRATRRKSWTTDLEKEEAELAEKGKLGEEARKKLNELGKAALETCSESWDAWFADHLLTLFELSGEAASLLEKLNPANTVYQIVAPEASEPLTSAAWKDGVKTLVDAKVLTDLEKERATRREQVMEDITDKLAEWEDMMADSSRDAVRIKMEQLEQFANISEEKKQALGKAADEAVKQAMASCRQRYIRMLSASTDAERLNYLNQRTPPFQGSRGLVEKSEYQLGWLKALKELIGPEDLAKVEEGRTQSRARREQALAMLTLAEMEKIVGFGTSQRDVLLVEACQQIKTLPAKFYDRDERNSYSSIDFGELLGRIKKIPAELTKKLLTESQLRRWESLTAEQLTNDRSNYAARRPVEKPKEEPAPPDLDEAGAQRLIGLALEREAANWRKEAQNQMEASAEMVIAATKPPLPVEVRIRTAAKGAAEEKAQEAISMMEQQVFSQLRNVKPADVPKRLQSLSFSSGYSRQNESEPALWTSCLKRLLTESQQAAWNHEQKERAGWLRSAISAVLVTDLTKSLTLSPEKSEALRKKLDELIGKYGEDITSIFSRRWYLQSYYGPIPLAILTEKELAEFFTAPQLQTLRGGAFGRAGQYAEMIKQRHKQRTKKD